MKNLSCAIIGLLLFGCSTTEKTPDVPVAAPVVPAVSAPAPAQPPVPKKDFTSADMRRTVNAAVYNMLKSGTLDNPAGGKYVVVVGRVVNTTAKDDFDTAQTVQDLKRALAASRKVRVVAAQNKTVDPQIFVAGRITHRVAHLAGRKQRQEYYLHLYVTEAKTGSSLWDAPFPIVHREVKGKTSK
ncbi:MAG TPA: hypothetical protein DD624_04210 [Alphaproteobacteria bacterium]|nr:hypothetical protein [Alphaproteobacteria bacterium]